MINTLTNYHKLIKLHQMITCRQANPFLAVIVSIAIRVPSIMKTNSYLDLRYQRDYHSLWYLRSRYQRDYHSLYINT